MNTPAAPKSRWTRWYENLTGGPADPAAEAWYKAQAAASRRVPLTTSQHILHLLLTVFTAGLWAPVWIWLAIRGNRG